MKLTDEQIRAFRTDGVVVVENTVTAVDLTPVMAEYDAWVDRRANELYNEGVISDIYAGLPLAKRFAELYAQSPMIGIGMDIMHMRGTAMFDFLRCDNLLDAVESLIGPEITCNPIQHIRAKPPAAMSGENILQYNIPWHQDSGVTWEEADDSDIITCWVAMLDATVENGCMEVLPGAWKLGHLTHVAGAEGTTIQPDLLPDIAPQPVPVKAGGAVFMHRNTPHRSTPNFTDSTRWSIDLRYQPTGVPTGRPFHPDFIARSRKHPETVLTDHAEWSRLWVEALTNAVNVQAHRVK